MNLNSLQIKELLFRVLRDMILQIREESYKLNLESIYEKTDLIHNIPNTFLTEEMEKGEEEKLREAYSWLLIYIDHNSQFSEYLLKQIKIVRRENNV